MTTIVVAKATFHCPACGIELLGNGLVEACDDCGTCMHLSCRRRGDGCRVCDRCGDVQPGDE